MRIFSPQLGLSENSQLGGEVHDSFLINSLCRKGVEFKVLLPKNKRYKRNINLKIGYLPIRSIFPPHIFNLIALPYMVASFKKESFNILRVHSPYFLGISAVIFKRIFPSVKVVTTIHLKEERWDLKLILNKTIHIYDHIFTVSSYLKKWIIDEYKISPDKISVIYNGVEDTVRPLEKDNRLVKKFSLNSKLVLLNLGSLNQRKNVTFLLSLFQRIKKKYNNTVLFFCGDGPLKNSLKTIIIQNKLTDSVFILNPVYGKKKNKIYNLSDIFLFPSKEEGFGLVVAEAMRCRKPVIASNNSSLPELIADNKTGFLSRTNDINDWFIKTSKLIENKKLRNLIGKRAETFAKKEFKWGKVADRTIKIYKQILG